MPRLKKKRKKSSGGKHYQKARLVRMDDSFWEFLEERKRRTKVCVVDQIRQLVRREIDLTGSDQAV